MNLLVLKRQCIISMRNKHKYTINYIDLHDNLSDLYSLFEKHVYGTECKWYPLADFEFCTRQSMARENKKWFTIADTNMIIGAFDIRASKLGMSCPEIGLTAGSDNGKYIVMVCLYFAFIIKEYDTICWHTVVDNSRANSLWARIGASIHHQDNKVTLWTLSKNTGITFLFKHYKVYEQLLLNATWNVSLCP